MADKKVLLEAPQIVFDDVDGHTIARESDASYAIQTRRAWELNWITVDSRIRLNWLQWNLAPTPHAAELHYRYGNEFNAASMTDPENEPAYESVDARDFLRRFVKITVFTESAQKLYFCGTIEIEGRTHLGEQEFDLNTNFTQPGGEQTFLCYGMEYQLKQNPILFSWWLNQNKAGPGVPGVVQVERGLTFNEGGKPNRSQTRITFTRNPGETNTSYLFNVDFIRGQTPDSRYWSSRDIVEYLVQYHAPRYSFGLGTVPIPIVFGPLLDVPNADLNNPAQTVLSKIPDDDRPVIEQHGRTPWELLNDILARQRYMSWWLEFYPKERSGFQEDVFMFFCDTFTEDAVVLPTWTIPGNDNTLELDVSKDPGAELVVKEDFTNIVDQVVVSGARRRNCFTVAADNPVLGAPWIGTFEPEWTATEENAWLTGAYGEPEYIALTNDDEKHEFILRFRTRPELSNVFRKFQLVEERIYPPGPVTDPEKNTYFPGLRILESLPLLEQVDYSGTRISDGFAVFATLSNLVERKPLVVFEVTDKSGDTVFVDGDKVGSTVHAVTRGAETQRSWSVNVRQDRTGPYFYLDVVGGAYQQAIAQADFSPPAGRPERRSTSGDPIHPGFTNWQRALVTIAVEDDIYCEASHPDIVPVGVNEIRRYFIDAGPQYRLDWVSENTVVDVAPNGQLVLCTASAFVRDDRIALLAIAQMAYAFYSVPRRAVVLDLDAQVVLDENGDPLANSNYPWLRGSFLGMVIANVIYSDGTSGSFATDQPINTIVSRLQITWPSGESSQQIAEIGRARMMVETDFINFDPIHFQQQRPFKPFGVVA